MNRGKYGLDPLHLLQLVIRPVLQACEVWSTSAEILVLGTGMCESRLRYLDQIDGLGMPGKPGPAYGIYQCEKLTHEDYWTRYFSMHMEDLMRYSVSSYPDPTELHWNLAYATLCCRVHYLLISSPLPPGGDARKLAQYYKRHYNTVRGKGDVDQAEGHFLEAIEFARAA